MQPRQACILTLHGRCCGVRPNGQPAACETQLRVQVEEGGASVPAIYAQGHPDAKVEFSAPFIPAKKVLSSRLVHRPAHCACISSWALPESNIGLCRSCSVVSPVRATGRLLRALLQWGLTKRCHSPPEQG